MSGGYPHGRRAVAVSVSRTDHGRAAARCAEGQRRQRGGCRAASRDRSRAYRSWSASPHRNHGPRLPMQGSSPPLRTHAKGLRYLYVAEARAMYDASLPAVGTSLSRIPPARMCSDTVRAAPCAPPGSVRSQKLRRSLVICTGRPFGASRTSSTGSRRAPTRRVEDAEQLLQLHRGRDRAVRLVVERMPIGRSARGGRSGASRCELVSAVPVSALRRSMPASERLCVRPSAHEAGDVRLETGRTEPAQQAARRRPSARVRGRRPPEARAASSASGALFRSDSTMHAVVVARVRAHGCRTSIELMFHRAPSVAQPLAIDDARDRMRASEGNRLGSRVPPGHRAQPDTPPPARRFPPRPRRHGRTRAARAANRGSRRFATRSG